MESDLFNDNMRAVGCNWHNLLFAFNNCVLYISYIHLLYVM